MNQMYKINGNPKQFADLNVFHKLSQQFLPYAQEKLGFDKPVGINLLSDPQNAKNPLGKTAYYDPNKMEVTVFVDKRHVKDILRSMSHELVHHTQCCRGEFDGGVDTGPGYAQEDGHMRKMEEEAYLEGQMLLRDFEDKLKEKKVMAEVQNKDKADLDKDGELSSYEKKRGQAIEKSMAAEGKEKKCPHCDGNAPKSKCICDKLDEVDSLLEDEYTSLMQEGEEGGGKCKKCGDVHEGSCMQEGEDSSDKCKKCGEVHEGHCMQEDISKAIKKGGSELHKKVKRAGTKAADALSKVFGPDSDRPKKTRRAGKPSGGDKDRASKEAAKAARDKSNERPTRTRWSKSKTGTPAPSRGASAGDQDRASKEAAKAARDKSNVNEGWTNKKDKLLFERLTKLWTK